MHSTCMTSYQMLLYKRIAMYLLITVMSLKLAIVNGDYVLQVRTHSYNNPTNRCAVCGTRNQGCCDDFTTVGNCTGNLRCDNYFYYCLRPLGSTGAGCVGGQTTLTEMNDGLIDFTQDVVLGLPNPLPLNGISPTWEGVQLYVEVTDDEFSQENNTDDLIDRFVIDILTTTAPVGVETLRTSYEGIFGFSMVELSIRVVCAENYYGPECSQFCEQDCSCDPGFTGEFCETNINECLTMAANCSGNGDCGDEINSYSCTCDPGFTGELCEISVNCSSGDCNGDGGMSPSVAAIAGGVGGGLVLLGVVLISLSVTIIFLIRRQRKNGSSPQQTLDDNIELKGNIVYGVTPTHTENAEQETDREYDVIREEDTDYENNNELFRIQSQVPLKEDEYVNVYAAI